MLTISFQQCRHEDALHSHLGAKAPAGDSAAKSALEGAGNVDTSPYGCPRRLQISSATQLRRDDVDSMSAPRSRAEDA